MKHKQLITFLKNKGFFLVKKVFRKTENGKRIVDKDKSRYSVYFSSHTDSVMEVAMVFDNGILQFSRFFMYYVHVSCVNNGLIIVKEEWDKANSDQTNFNIEESCSCAIETIFDSIKKSENEILCEIVHRLALENDNLLQL